MLVSAYVTGVYATEFALIYYVLVAYLYVPCAMLRVQNCVY